MPSVARPRWGSARSNGQSASDMDSDSTRSSGNYAGVYNVFPKWMFTTYTVMPATNPNHRLRGRRMAGGSGSIGHLPGAVFERMQPEEVFSHDGHFPGARDSDLSSLPETFIDNQPALPLSGGEGGRRRVTMGTSSRILPSRFHHPRWRVRCGSDLDDLSSAYSDDVTRKSPDVGNIVPPPRHATYAHNNRAMHEMAEELRCQKEHYRRVQELQNLQGQLLELHTHQILEITQKVNEFKLNYRKLGSNGHLSNHGNSRHLLVSNQDDLSPGGSASSMQQKKTPSAQRNKISSPGYTCDDNSRACVISQKEGRAYSTGNLMYGYFNSSDNVGGPSRGGTSRKKTYVVNNEVNSNGHCDGGDRESKISRRRSSVLRKGGSDSPLKSGERRWLAHDERKKRRHGLREEHSGKRKKEGVQRVPREANKEGGNCADLKMMRDREVVMVVDSKSLHSTEVKGQRGDDIERQQGRNTEKPQDNLTTSFGEKSRQKKRCSRDKRQVDVGSSSDVIAEKVRKTPTLTGGGATPKVKKASTQCVVSGCSVM